MGIKNGCRHEFFRFIAGISEHHALIACALFLEESLAFGHALRNIGGLGVNAEENFAGRGGESDVGGCITDVGDDFADDGFPIDFCFRGDLSGNDNEVGCAERFTCDAAFGILCEAGVENRIGNLVGNFIGMSFGNGFRGENVFSANLAHSENDSFFTICLCCWQV